MESKCKPLFSGMKKNVPRVGGERSNLPPIWSYTWTRWKVWRQMGQLLALTVHALRHESCRMWPQTWMIAILLSLASASSFLVVGSVISGVLSLPSADKVRVAPATATGRSARETSEVVVLLANGGGGAAPPPPAAGPPPPFSSSSSCRCNCGRGTALSRFSRQTMHWSAITVFFNFESRAGFRQGDELKKA